MATPPVRHDIMIARFDKAAKDEVEAEEPAGEGHGLWTARVNPCNLRRDRGRCRCNRSAMAPPTMAHDPTERGAP
jgi:hypothetical protein